MSPLTWLVLAAIAVIPNVVVAWLFFRPRPRPDIADHYRVGMWEERTGELYRTADVDGHRIRTRHHEGAHHV